MSKPVRIALAALVFFVGFVTYHAVTSSSWSGPLNVPPGVAARTVSFTCGPVWGSSSVHGPATTAYAVQGTPCGARHSDRIMTSIDVVGGVLAILLMASWGRIQRRSESTAKPSTP